MCATKMDPATSGGIAATARILQQDFVQSISWHHSEFYDLGPGTKSNRSCAVLCSPSNEADLAERLQVMPGCEHDSRSTLRPPCQRPSLCSEATADDRRSHRRAWF